MKQREIEKNTFERHFEVPPVGEEDGIGGVGPPGPELRVGPLVDQWQPPDRREHQGEGNSRGSSYPHTFFGWPGSGFHIRVS